MNPRVHRTQLLLGATALLAILVVPVAVAGTESSADRPLATASSVKEKVKKLSNRVNRLHRKLAALERRPGPRGRTGPQGPPGPSTGPAGGDLAGSYPNPEIAPGGIGADQLEPRAVGATAINFEAVGSEELSVTSAPSSDTEIASGGVGSVTVACPGQSQMISGGADFEFASGELSASRPFANGWLAAGENNGTVAQDLRVWAVCLQPGTS